MNCRASTSLAFGFLLVIPGFYASAQTTVTGSGTTPQSTSTGGDVTVSSSGSITLGSGNAITVNSNNSATNDGTITISDAPGTSSSAGILAVGGYGSATATITNAGSINNTDSSPSTVEPLAPAGELNRYGIEVAAEDHEVFTGTINNAAGASITIIGNASAGIALLTGVNGAITDSGTINVTGNNAQGILINAPLSGALTVSDAIITVGTKSNGIAINSQVGGEVLIDSTVSSTGYYNGGETTARPTYFSGLTAANFQIGGPSVSITGSLEQGLTVDTNGQLFSYGTAAALEIAPSSGTVNINALTGSLVGISIAGQVEGNGIYDGESSGGIQIGTLGIGGKINVQGGINVTGTVSATSYAASATGIAILGGSSVPVLANSGTISATVNYGVDSNAAVGGNATAIVVANGAVSSILNSGVISATTASGQAYALDLRGDTVFVTVDQNAAASGATTASTITGDVAFGNKGAALNMASGVLTGALSYGASTSNALTITGGAVVDGAVTQASGGSLALSVLDGRLASTSTSSLAVNSLTIGSNGQINFAVNPTNLQSGTLTVSGQAQILSGAKIGLSLDAQLTAPETFTVVQTTGAGTLIGSSASIGSLPYFYLANVDQNDAAGTISIKVSDRTFQDAGVQGTASAYNAVFAANYADPGIRDAFNAAGSQQAFKQAYQQMLPSYSGGLFEILQQGTNAIASTEAANPLEESGQHGGGWAQQVGFAAEQSTRSTPGYHGGGLGFAFGWETPISNISSWGVTASYIRGSVDDFNTGPNNQQVGTVYGAGAYWRENDGAFRTDASINVGVAEMNSTRNFSAADLNGTMVTRSATSAWTGGVAQAHLGVSYEQPIGGGYYVRPLVAGDYFVLYSEKYSERNGGPGFNLNVASSTGKQGSVTGGVAVGTRWGDKLFLWRPEAMVGYKQVFGGADSVTAAFAGGQSFTLDPASQKGGPIANLGIHGGNKYSDIAVEAGGEDRGPYTSFDGRVVARFRF
jgi:hypothetical protein